jgi:DNA polymerase-3 subunit epsilon
MLLDTLQAADREQARRWARGLLGRSDWAVLDTETTGLDDWAEVIQVAVVTPDGSTAIDTLVRPRRYIPADATAIHGITNEMVAVAPSFEAIHSQLSSVLDHRTIVAYNAAFDRRVLAQTALVNEVKLALLSWECAMERYAQFVGQRSYRRSGYVWQKLPRKAEYRGKKHQAVDDCLATLDVIRRMAE